MLGARAASRQKRNSFTSTWDTRNAGTSSGNQITLPLKSTTDYDFVVHWGDGTQDNITVYNQPEVTHTYPESGIYEVRIGGGITGWQFNNSNDKLKIIFISNWEDLTLDEGGATTAGFYGCSNLDCNATDAFKWTSVGSNDSMISMFQQCINLSSIGRFNPGDYPQITDIQRMFINCDSFNQDIGFWNVSNINLMFNLFSNADAFNNGGSPSISGWDMSNVVGSIQSMLGTAFNQPIGSWDVGNVSTFRALFQNNTVFNQDISNWDTSSAVSFEDLFEGASSFTGDISNWNTTGVTIFQGVFLNNDGFNGSLSGWDTSSATTTNVMFQNNDAFNQDIGHFQFPNLTIASNMFLSATAFNNGGSDSITGWSFPKLTNYSAMFQNATSFNQPIGAWDMSKATNIGSMFRGATSFDQDLSNWTVTGITIANEFMFQNSAALSTENYDRTLSGWAQQSGDLQSGVSIHFGTSQYSIATGEQYKEILSGAGWTIVDGGSV
jgi:surface protein